MYLVFYARPLLRHSKGSRRSVLAVLQDLYATILILRNESLYQISTSMMGLVCRFTTSKAEENIEELLESFFRAERTVVIC